MIWTVLVPAGGRGLRIKLPYQKPDGERKWTGSFPKEYSGPVAIGLTTARAVAFAEVHAQQMSAAGGAAPKNEQTADEFEKLAHHLWSKTSPGNLRPQDGKESNLLIDSVEQNPSANVVLRMPERELRQNEQNG